MRQIVTVAALLALCCGSALADAPSSSLRPVLRPAAPAETTLAAQAAALAGPISAPRPRARPITEQMPVAAQPLAALAVMVAPASTVPVAQRGAFGDGVGVLSTMSMAAPLSVPRPAPRPRLSAPDNGAGALERIEPAAAVRILPGKSAITGRKGSVCGDPAIKGEVLAPITSRVRGCGIDEPVRVTSVDGVALKQSAVIDCTTARALREWVSEGLKPAFGRKDVAALRIAGSYSCRTRNNVKGAPISEHGRGKALDIAAIELANGSTVTVLGDWRRSAGKPMKKAYNAACGIFGTTLGPNSDRFHRDHMHFDTARQRGGAYWR
jgi:hypothetical protein